MEVDLIVATAPGRCGIVGNPTDIYGGCVLSVTTTERAKCTLEPSDTLTLVCGDEHETMSDIPPDFRPRGDKLDIARAGLAYFDIDRAKAQFTLTLSTDIPMQAGMAGSTALVVAVVGALDRYFTRGMHPWAIAETARKIEYRRMGVLCGFQDQHMAVFGGLNFMSFAGKESLEQRDGEPYATIESLSDRKSSWTGNLLLAHTGVQHHSGAVHKSPRQRWLEGDSFVVDTYRRMAELAGPGKRAWLDEDWHTLGALMNENHALTAGLGGSGPENDRLIETARRAGAWGAKLAGAGGGGTIIALCDDVDRVGQALRNAGADSLMFPSPMPGLTVSEG